MADENGRLKIAAAGLLIVAALALAYYFMNAPQGGGTGSLVLGNEININTFSAILANSSDVYLIMDVRGVNDTRVNQSIMQCGVDLAGSTGLAGKTMTIYSLETQGCLGAVQQGNKSVFANYTSAYCFGQAGNGIALYLHQGNETHFYTNAMVVGLGENYTVGGCSIRAK